MSMNDQKKPDFMPPPRPDWVARVNDEGRALDLGKVVPLDVDSLLASARASTGLDHFGDDDWYEPFREFVTSVNTEAQLNLMGRLMTRSDLLCFLEGRLRVEETYRRNPEIENVQIERPIWVFGQGRSGTSLLQTLLGLDPDNRTPTQWEALFPVPFTDSSGQDRRRETAGGLLDQWNRVTPEIRSMHEFSADAPAESINLEALSFRTPAWLNLLGVAPSYNRYMATQPVEKSFAYAKRIAKVMQWANPRSRWVFKSPDSIHHLPALLTVFPDIRLVWAHRDPVKTMASAVSLIGTLTWIRSDQRLHSAAFEGVTHPSVVASALNKPIDWIESGVIAQEQLCNIQYQSLVENPLGTVQDIYRHFDIPMTDVALAAIKDYMAAHPRTARPAHRYAVGDDQHIQEQRKAFAAYQAYFNVPNEI